MRAEAPPAAAKPKAKAPAKAAASGAAGKSKFLEFNEKWLEETEDMAADFVNTPAMQHLKAGSFGARRAPEPQHACRRPFSARPVRGMPPLDAPRAAEVPAATRAGKVGPTELGFDPAAAISTAVHATLARCLHTMNVIRTIGMFHEGVIPRKVCNQPARQSRAGALSLPPPHLQSCHPSALARFELYISSLSIHFMRPLTAQRPPG